MQLPENKLHPLGEAKINQAFLEAPFNFLLSFWPCGTFTFIIIIIIIITTTTTTIWCSILLIIYGRTL